jgi:excisionase family DNA binding protein
MEPTKPNEELNPEELLAVLPEVIRTLDGMNAQRILITPLPAGGWEFTVDQDKALFYTLEQLSLRLGVSEREIRKWVRRRIITVYKPTTKMLFRLDEVLTDLTRFRLRSVHDPERNSRKLEFKVRL